MLAAGGGIAWSPYAGCLTTSCPATATAVQLEPNDVLDSVPGDNTIDFILKVANTALDGMDISIPDVSLSCFQTNSIPSGAQVFIGKDKTVKNGAFNLEDLGVCQ